MSPTRPLATLLALCALACSHRPGAPTPSTSVAITHVTIIDVTGGPPKRDMTVVITGSRISSITPADSTILPATTVAVDGRGKFLIPGLWDMHVHAAWPDMAVPVGELFVANGVTGVRDMWGDPDVIARWRARVAHGDERAPRLVAAGNLVDGPDPVWPNSMRVTTAADARRLVGQLIRDGVPFIKVYSHLPREAYFAIAAEARRAGIPFAGHVSIVVTAAEASDSGQRSIEHLTGVALGCSSHEDAIMRAITSTVAARGWAAASAMERGAAAELTSSFDAARCRALAEKFARNGTWQVPTLTVLHNMAWLGDPAMENDPRIRYIPRFVQQRWQARTEAIAAGAANIAARRALYGRELEIVGLMNAAGVPILAGTDELNPYCMPGFSLHDEMERLVGAGLTPLEALRAATLNPATFFGATDSLGTVATGKLADLVLLDADPLVDIRNTTHIAAVVLNGRLIDDAARQRMLDDAARATGR